MPNYNSTHTGPEIDNLQNQINIIKNREYYFIQFPDDHAIYSDSNPSISREITVTSSGRPLYISFIGELNPTSDNGTWCYIQLFRDGVQIHRQECVSHELSANIPFAISYLDIVPAGTYVYKCSVSKGGAGNYQLNESGQNGPNFTVFEI